MPLDRDRLLQNLAVEEGFSAFPYKDTQGILTTGYGWNLEGKPLTRERAKIILGWFLDDAIHDLFTALPWAATLPDSVQLALADMSYNLGIVSLLKFTTFLAMLKSGNYSGAADDLKLTLWARQVGSRAETIESLIRNPV